MKTTRIAPGYYTAKCETKLDGETLLCTAEICKVEGNPFWYIRLETEDGLSLLDGGDWIETKRDAVCSLDAACKAGFSWVNGLGACVNNC